MKQIKKTASLVLALLVIFTTVFGTTILNAEAADYSAWSAVFDPAYYNANNKEAAAYAKGNVDRLWEYFSKIGIPKGDQASEEFNVFIYAKNYPQLTQAFGGKMAQYYIHYATQGKAQGLNARTLNDGNNTANNVANNTTIANTTGLNGITAAPAVKSSEVYKSLLNGIASQQANLKYTGSFNEYSSILEVMMDSNLKTADELNANGYSLSSYGNSITIGFAYVDDASETAVVKSFITQTAPGLKGANNYQTIKNVHDFICDNANYDYDTYRGYGDAYGAYENLILKSSVCMGYAAAFQRYMEYYGIPCFIATSTDHAWNIVYLDGAWYHVDTTWDGQDKKTRSTYFLLGANKCGYSQYGNQYSQIITMAAKAYGK